MKWCFNLFDRKGNSMSKLIALLAVMTLCLLIGGGKTSAQTLERINDYAAMSPDGNFVAIPDLSQDLQEILILDRNLQTINRLGLDWTQPSSEGRLYTVARITGSIVWRPDGTMLAAPLQLFDGNTTYFQTVVWEVQNGNVVLRWMPSKGDTSWSPSGQYLAIDSMIVDINTGNVVNELPFWEVIRSV